MNRSKDGALEELQALRQTILINEKDPSVAKIVTAELLERILDIAWRHQFDEERTGFRLEIQQVVGDAIERYYLDQGGKVKIAEVQLQNFGPYHGVHSVDLSTSEDAPVIVMHGENTWGKTLFINSIRWCLYGRVRGIDRREKALWRLVNRDAHKSGERTMSVKLVFWHAAQKYELERLVAFKEPPSTRTKFTQRVRLIEDGTVVEDSKVTEKIGAILHEDISRFFLFDAEMLDEFERLVESADNSAVLVKQQIEKALGLPALRLADEDLRSLQDAADRKKFKSLRDTKKGAEIEADAREAEDELRAVENDLLELKSLANEHQQRREVARERRAQFAEIQIALSEVEKTEDLIRTLETQEQEVRKSATDVLAGAWWLPLARELRARAAEASQAVETARQTRDRAVQLEASIEAIEKSLRDQRCAQCDQPLPDSLRNQMQRDLDRLQADLSAAEPQADYDMLVDRLRALQPFIVGASPETFRDREVQLRRILLDLRTARRRLKEVEEQIASHDRDEIRRVEEEYETAVVALAAVVKDIDDKDKRRDELRGTLAGLKKDAEKLPGQNPRISTEARVYDVLRQVFAKGIDQFRERMRADVEKEASEIFVNLTTEKEFAGLRINDNYGLVIVDKAGDPMPDRSAGAAQTIALALVGALNKSALREAPLVVDTPLGRLDLGHRANVLRFFPTMGAQVMFMPHSGEFDRKQHLPLLEGKISRELKIMREHLRSRIVPFNS